MADPSPTPTLVSRYAVVAVLAAAVLAGAALAVKRHAQFLRAPIERLRPQVIVADRDASPDGRGIDGAVATVIPNARRPDAGARRWPPSLLNPGASPVMAWDLALGRPNAREIFFTFDDGPNPGTTDRLLAQLDRYRIKAAFFVVGWRLETDEPLRSRARALLRDIRDRGHVIGNHTVHHRVLAQLTPEQVRYEIDHNAALIEEVTGQKPHLFRPPYGSCSDEVRRRVAERGNELWLWSVDSHDWQKVGDAQGVAMTVIRLLGNMAGGTVLMHDTHPWSVSAAQMIFRWLEQENRERQAAGRPVYVVPDPADYLEGARVRIPMIEAERARAEAEGRTGRGRDGGAGPQDAGRTASPAEPAMGMGAGAGMGMGDAPADEPPALEPEDAGSRTVTPPRAAPPGDAGAAHP